AEGRQDKAKKINNLSQEQVVKSLQIKITESANDLLKYLGLNNRDLPCLVLLCLADQKAIVIQWSNEDEEPYDFFKEVIQRSPNQQSPNQWGPWLSKAVDDVARKNGRKQGKPPKLKPNVLKGWETVRYLPRKRTFRNVGLAILKDPQFALGIGVLLAGVGAV